MTRRTSLLTYRVLMTCAAALLTAVVVDAAERATEQAPAHGAFDFRSAILR